MTRNPLRTFFQQTGRSATEMWPRAGDIAQPAQPVPPQATAGAESLEKRLTPAPAYLYRFDSRPPEIVFREGFHARDNCELNELRLADLDNHVSDPALAKRRSKAAFISTSTDKDFCKKYGVGFLINRAIGRASSQDQEAVEGFIYKISGVHLHGFRINEMLPRNHEFADEHEVAIHRHIDAAKIMKAESCGDKTKLRNPRCDMQDDPGSDDDSPDLAASRTNPGGIGPPP